MTDADDCNDETQMVVVDAVIRDKDGISLFELVRFFDTFLMVMKVQDVVESVQ
jgi:hypothetical protein